MSRSIAVADRPLVFLSHASRDKPEIGHIVDYLTGHGYALFIDHPEGIGAKFSPEYCAANGITTLWTSAGETNWSARLKRALAECDCVLVVASDALTPEGVRLEDGARLSEDTGHRVEWKAEILWGEALGKLAFAKIGSFRSEVLPSYVRLEDAIAVSRGLDPATLANNLDILCTQRIDPAIRSARKGARSDQFRTILDLLPLCVGRFNQRMQILRACDQLKRSGTARPVILASPDNELPTDFLDALTLIEDGTENHGQINQRHIDLSELRGPDFQAEFASRVVAKFLPQTPFEPLSAVADSLRGGHPVLAISFAAVDRRSLTNLPLREWLDFWRDFAVACPGLPILPVLSMRMGDATPGWSDCPPRPRDNRAIYKRNLAVWAWLQAEAKAQGAQAYDLPPILRPIKRLEALSWANDIRADVLGAVDRDRLEVALDATFYGAEPAKSDGLNHGIFTDRVRAWFKDMGKAA